MLVESGTVYCLVLVRITVPFKVAFPDITSVKKILTVILFITESDGVYIVTDTLSQVTVIHYYTLILVLSSDSSYTIGHLPNYHHHPHLLQTVMGEHHSIDDSSSITRGDAQPC